MHPFNKYPVLRSLVKNFESRHRNTLGLVLAALLASGSARSIHLAERISAWLGTLFQSALNRLYRFLGNHRFDELKLVRFNLRLLSQKLGTKLMVAIDWTEWHDDLRMLVATVPCGRRSIPVYAAAFHESLIPRSQNSRENTFLAILADALKAEGLHAIILCDRGFRRVSWLKLLKQKGLDFVVRLKADVHATPRNGTPVRLDALVLAQGQQRDLGRVKLRIDGVFDVRVVGMRQQGMKDAWWLATSLQCGPRRLAGYYDRRMAIEENLRDTKGCRFGVRLYWTQFKRPENLGRMAMIVGVAMILWTAAGRAAVQRRPSLLYNHSTKGPRCSLVTIGIRQLQHEANLRELTLTRIVNLLPSVQVRKFEWLAA